MALPYAALGAALLLFQSPSAPSPSAPVTPPRRDSIVLRVLTTNDLHGRLESAAESWSNGRPVGGVAHIAGMMDRLAAECGCATIRVDAGDLMQGTPVSNLTYGRSTVDAANAMGYAAVAIGNHEFDWTIDTLAARIRQARFAWLSSNIITARAHRVPQWATPWKMVRAGPYTVALVGYTTPGTTTSTNPVNVATLGFAGAPMLDSAIRLARRQHPDFVIVLAHEGAFCNRDTGCQGAVITLADQLHEKPDLIVSGHTHSLVTTTEAGIPIIQARSNGTSLGIVDFVVTPGGRTPRMRVETVWADREPADTTVARIVAQYQGAIDSTVGRRVTVLAQPLWKDSALADMIAEALREAAGADIGIINNTGVRKSLMPGPVTWGDLSEVLPFGNQVVKMTVTGAVLRQVAEHAFSGDEPRARFAGLRVDADPTAPQGQRVMRMVLPDGRIVTDTGRYTIGTEDFLANGGSGYFMLRTLPHTSVGAVDLDAFIAFLQRQPQPVRWPPRSTP